MTATAQADPRIVILCRSPERRTLLGGLVAADEIYASPVDVCLSVARRPARAVVVNLEDIEGMPREVFAALRRAQPDLRIYTIVDPEDEPLARELLRGGATDYFVLPSDVRRLPETLACV